MKIFGSRAFSFIPKTELWAFPRTNMRNTVTPKFQIALFNDPEKMAVRDKAQESDKL